MLGLYSAYQMDCLVHCGHETMCCRPYMLCKGIDKQCSIDTTVQESRDKLITSILQSNSQA